MKYDCNESNLTDVPPNQSEIESEQLIDRIDISELTADDFYLKYRKHNRPVIITGGLKDVSHWSINLMRENLTEGEFPIRCYGPNHFEKPKSEWKKYCKFENMTVVEYTDQLISHHAHENNHYMAQTPIGHTPLAKVLRSSLNQLTEHTGMEPATDMGLWLGPNGHTEPLHWDCAEGTVLMLHGTKKVVLFPANQVKNLYPFPIFNSPAAPWISQVYVDKPDYDTFPKLNEAMKHKIVLTLNKGEILYIPALWWHELTSVGDDFYTCSVNRFWKVKPLRHLTQNKIAMALYLSQLAIILIAGAIKWMTSGSKKK